jgi:O-antigen/teichoic acid export membrane protein
VAAVKAVLWTTGSTYISYFLGLVVSVLIARSLGAAGYGRYAYLVWLSGILVLIANHGLTITGIKFVAECMGRNQSAHAAHAHAWLKRIQVASIVLVALVYLVVSPWLRPAGWEGHAWLLAGIVVTSFGFKAQSLLNTSIAKGYGQFSIEPLTNVVVTLLSAVTVVVLAVSHAGLTAYAIAFAGASIAYAMVSGLQLHRAGFHARDTGASARELVTRMRPHLFWTAVLAAVAAIGSRSIEMFLLNRWVGAVEVGYFAIAMALTRAGIDLLVAGLSSVMMPIMGYVFGTGDAARAQRLFGDACRYYQFFGLLIAGVGVCWAEVVVTLMYGAQYASVAPVFRIMIVTSGVLLANGAFSAVLANSDNQRFRVGVTLVSFAVTFVVAFALIPLYGVLGAASAQAVAAVLCAFIVVAGIRRFAGLHLPWRALLSQYALAAAVAALAFCIALVGGGHGAQWAAGVFFAMAFIGFSPAAGLWRDDERVFVAELLERRRGLKWLAVWLTPRPARGA